MNRQQENLFRQIFACTVGKEDIGKEVVGTNNNKHPNKMTKDKYIIKNQRLSPLGQTNPNAKNSLEENCVLNSLEENCVLNFLEEDCVSNSLEENFVLKSLEENCVKGKLKRHAKKWEEIGANKFIVYVIKNGYKIPFINSPKTRVFKNNLQLRKWILSQAQSIILLNRVLLSKQIASQEW